MPDPYAPSTAARHMTPGWKRASYWAFALLVAPTVAAVASTRAEDVEAYTLASALLLGLPPVAAMVLGVVLRLRALETVLAALLSIPAAGVAWFAWFVWNFSRGEWTIPISPPIAPFTF
jgi:hypothetical protein